MCLYVRTSSDPCSHNSSNFPLCLLKLIAAVISEETEKVYKYVAITFDCINFNKQYEARDVILYT
jgi:hypothetical protein